MPELQIDRNALKQILATRQFRLPGENAWCVACGASHGALKPDDLVAVLQDKGQQLLDLKALQDFALNLKNSGLDSEWCVACGASRGLTQDIGRPAEISDAQIEDLAQSLVGAIKAK